MTQRTERTYNIARSGKRVVADFRRLLETGDVDRITPGLYYALTMHAGFIAHFDIGGFQHYYRGRLAELLDGELHPLTNAWRWGDDDTGHSGTRRDLECSVYRDGWSAADVMRGICKVARELEADVRWRQAQQRRSAELAVAQRIADEYGVTLTPTDARAEASR